ncbi:MAG: AAA family ATPase [Chitinispirillaceae bacterium]|nr:AAA family ATPase [Chitinispirillaceae bacterium]
MNVNKIKRIIEIRKDVSNKSCFLFGPRQTGKSFLIREIFSDKKVYDLLDSEVFFKLARNPKLIEQELSLQDDIIVIDEIQKLPSLLDEVHRLIETKGLKFLLTGSSPRKLRRGGVNLLGGRAKFKILHPFCYKELKNLFELSKAINYGLLPSIYFSNSADEDLIAYTGLYLQEEIAAERTVRNIPAFSRFLQIAALMNGQLINYSKLSSDAMVALSTVHEYFEILKDTLIAFEVTAWKKTVKRKPISTSKFYFFDTGVVRVLQNRSILNIGTPEFGFAFEHWICHELKCFLDYKNLQGLNYWRSQSGYEVDFILCDKIAIEVKAKNFVTERDLSSLKALAEEVRLSFYLVISMDKNPRKIENILILPYNTFLEMLWDGEFGI